MSFRVKVRVKRWKIDLYREAIRKIWTEKEINPIPNMPIKTKCARCGMIWDRPMAYSCPHGSWCGVPYTDKAQYPFSPTLSDLYIGRN